MATTASSPNSLLSRLRRGNLATTFALLATLTVGVLAGSAITGKVFGKEQQAVNTADARPLSVPGMVNAPNSFSPIVKQVEPAVVSINTETAPKLQPALKQRRRGQQPQQPDDNEDPNDMQDFFNRFFGGNPGQMPDQGERRALGSGFIVDPRGYIITNNHVVEHADNIWVKLPSDPEATPGDLGRRATLVGSDKDTDIAVIKIDTKGVNLPTVKLGNSDGAQVGDWVLAIGSPFGLTRTVSAGIVSAKDRSIPEAAANGTNAAQFQRFIQTDAAINPGNSGGPLVDLTGQVIGMNTAIYTQSNGSEGIGFAMPSNTIISVYNMLIGPDHKVTRGSIGIQFQAALNPAVKRQYGLVNGGVIIGSIVPNGPAEKANLKPNDIILSVDGVDVKDGDNLVAVVSAKRPGTVVRLTYLRDGKRETANVTITDRAKLYDDMAKEDVDSGSDASADPGQSKLGISVKAVNPATATKLHINGGVSVTTIKPGSFAESISLFQGAVITEINRHAVTDEASYRALVNSLKSGDDVVFAVRDPKNPNNGISLIGGTLP